MTHLDGETCHPGSLWGTVGGGKAAKSIEAPCSSRDTDQAVGTRRPRPGVRGGHYSCWTGRDSQAAQKTQGQKSKVSVCKQRKEWGVGKPRAERGQVHSRSVTGPRRSSSSRACRRPEWSSQTMRAPAWRRHQPGSRGRPRLSPPVRTWRVRLCLLDRGIGEEPVSVVGTRVPDVGCDSVVSSFFWGGGAGLGPASPQVFCPPGPTHLQTPGRCSAIPR